MIRVLFVCSGNICRSPTAEGVFRKLLAEHGLAHLVAVDSAGTHDFHFGEPPDPRAQETARRRGVDLSGTRARKVRPKDFETFDLIVAMDRGHVRELLHVAPAGAEGRISLLLDYAPELGRADVPDPYYGGPRDFERAFALIEEGAMGLLDHIRAHRL